MVYKVLPQMYWHIIIYFKSVFVCFTDRTRPHDKDYTD